MNKKSLPESPRAGPAPAVRLPPPSALRGLCPHRLAPSHSRLATSSGRGAEGELLQVMGIVAQGSPPRQAQRPPGGTPGCLAGSRAGGPGRLRRAGFLEGPLSRAARYPWVLRDPDRAPSRLRSGAPTSAVCPPGRSQAYYSLPARRGTHPWETNRQPTPGCRSTSRGGVSGPGRPGAGGGRSPFSKVRVVPLVVLKKRRNAPPPSALDRSSGSMLYCPVKRRVKPR